MTHPRENAVDVSRAIQEAIDLSDQEVARLLQHPPRGFLQKLKEIEAQYPRRELHPRPSI